MIYSAFMNEPANTVDPSSIESFRPFRGPFTRWPRLSDAVLAFVSFLLTFAMWTGGQPDDADPSFGEFMLFVIGNASLYWRRRHPERVHIIVMVVSALAMLLDYLHGPIFALAFSIYNIGRHSADTRRSAFGLIAALVLIIVGELAHGTFTSEDLFQLFLPVAIWFIGRSVRGRGEYLRLLKERAEQLEREQLVEAEKAVAKERTRIARELHDIVAHQVSLMTVQAGAAKTIVDTDPKAASEAMGSVEVAGRQALDELRHLLGVLRPETEDNELGPQPGRAELTRLIEDVERAGLNVALLFDDDHRPLPARVELAIYRIIQEALTNVLKHAGPGARAEVSVRADDRAVTIEIKDDGVGGTRLPGSGHGITGMRERAQSLGGTLRAGPRARGGFEVIAQLPISEDVL